jgi:molecular chaperone DnaK (HSP70)
MARIGIDFGTGNTVIAVFNENLGSAETLEIPGISTPMRYRFSERDPEQLAHVVPSLIHYSATETLVGDQVLARGLAEHPDTFRWMKRAVAQNNTRRRKTAQGHKSGIEAGTDFLTLALNYATDRLSFENDEFTFTAPTEAFETFQDWLRRLTEAIGIRRLRLLDEPTACVLGYHGAARRDDCFGVYDHGCGTLDVSIVKVDLAAAQDRKATQLGQAGRDLGGMDIDRWVFEDFCQRHALDDYARRDLEALILRQAEATKILLSDPTAEEGVMQVLNDRNGVVRMLRTAYRRSCPDCERGRVGKHEDHGTSCLGCLLLNNQFLPQARATVDRALENAAVKAGVRRDGIVRVLVTGGTSLVPAVGHLLRDYFGDRVEYTSPFDAVARGACQGTVLPILQHDYAIESYNRTRNDYEFAPLFKIGTDYPTGRDAVRFWARGAYDGQVRIGLKIFEVSRMKRVRLTDSLVDEHGAIKEESKVQTEFSYVCLNRENPTFIISDPPVNLQRDPKRFLCSFWVDGQRRLLVSVLDNHSGKTLLKDHPVVRL